MSKNQVLRHVQSGGAFKGAPRNQPVVGKEGNRMVRKPKGYHGGKLSKQVEKSL